MIEPDDYSEMSNPQVCEHRLDSPILDAGNDVMKLSVQRCVRCGMLVEVPKKLTKAVIEAHLSAGVAMNTCDTCIWWGNGQLGHDGTNVYRTCDNERMVGRGEPDGMEVVNGEPFNGGEIATGPLFGCIHHEPKEEDPLLPEMLRIMEEEAHCAIPPLTKEEQRECATMVLAFKRQYPSAPTEFVVEMIAEKMNLGPRIEAYEKMKAREQKRETL